MTRRGKSVLLLLVTLALCSSAAVWVGGALYSSWWDISWVPMPPLCRFVLPHRMVGYDLVHDEMVFLSFLACAISVLLFRQIVKRSQNKTLDRMTRSAVSRLFQMRRQWRAPRHRSALR